MLLIYSCFDHETSIKTQNVHPFATKYIHFLLVHVKHLLFMSQIDNNCQGKMKNSGFNMQQQNIPENSLSLKTVNFFVVDLASK